MGAAAVLSPEELAAAAAGLDAEEKARLRETLQETESDTDRVGAETDERARLLEALQDTEFQHALLFYQEGAEDPFVTAGVEFPGGLIL